MICAACRSPLAEDARRCPSCGKVVVRRSTSSLARPRPRRTVPRILLILLLSVGGAAAIVGSYWFVKIRPRMLALEGRDPDSKPGRARKLSKIAPASADFDLSFEVPGRPQGLASNGRELISGSGSAPWGAFRIEGDGKSYKAQGVPIIVPPYRQKMSLNTITWNGRNYVGIAMGSWFQKEGDVFTVHDPRTLQVIRTVAAPPLLGGLAWDGRQYWAATRKNTADSDEEPWLYQLDDQFNTVTRFKPPGIGCQGLAWDGHRLWYVDVFSDMIKVLDVTTVPPSVVYEAMTPIEYLSGVVFHDGAIWVSDYGKNRLQRLRETTRLAWVGNAGSAQQPAVASVLTGTFRPVESDQPLTFNRDENRFADRKPDDAEDLDWSVELRDNAIWLASSRLWFGHDLFTAREQTSTIVTVPVFARYRYTVKKPDGTEVERTFDAIGGENILGNVRLADATEAGTYSVSLFIHVQYVDANGTGRILNNSAGFLELRK